MVNKRHRHAYLISGVPQIGKMALALRFAAALQCEHEDVEQRPCGVCTSCHLLLGGNHPDLLTARADEKTGAIKIDAVRELMRAIALKPYSSPYRVAILENFDNAQDRAQDALLKTLEEPPPHAVLILLVSSPKGVLSTITSRCQTLPLRPLPIDTVKQALLTYGAEEEQAALLAQLSAGRIGWALEALHQPQVLENRMQILTALEEALSGRLAQRFKLAEDLARYDKVELRLVLEIWQTYLRDLVLLTHQSPVMPCNLDRLSVLNDLTERINADQALKALRATNFLLEDTLYTNANVRLALEVMLMDYPASKSGHTRH
jgi:DNA polymerase-3 subunit delta'